MATKDRPLNSWEPDTFCYMLYFIRKLFFDIIHQTLKDMIVTFILCVWLYYE